MGKKDKRRARIEVEEEEEEGGNDLMELGESLSLIWYI